MNTQANREFFDADFVSDEMIHLSSFEQLRLATDVVREEAEALHGLSKNLPPDFLGAVKLVSECSGNVIVTGIGKAGWIGQKVSATLASTGTRSHFLHPSEAVHGDLGRVGPDDVLLVFSNSGETGEIACLLPALAKLQTTIIAVTSKTDSTLARQSVCVLNYGEVKEACPLGLAPSTTTTMMLALGDALALVVARVKSFQAIDFARFHPGGSLGRKLSSVEDVMRPISECRVALDSETVREVYIRLGGKDRRAGAVLVNNESGELTGIFTDSDLAKLLELELENLFDQPIGCVMTQTPITIPAGTKTLVAIETLANRNLSELPVVDPTGKALGIVEITDVVKL